MTTASVDRRTVIKGSAAAAGTATVVAASGSTAEGASAYFAHGVASGDPMPDRVVIWTRVTPTSTSTPGSGRGPRVWVDYEVASDRAFRRIVKKGRIATGASNDHTVKLDVTGLQPARWYFYRFSYKGRYSRVGRTRTAPAHSSTPSRVRLGMVSCSNLQAGWFSAYRHLAQRNDLHAIVHLGDYIYEYGPGQYGYGNDNVDIRKHSPAREMVSLADYRQRHAQYKRDADLQELHARYPFIVTWDDHEVTNDANKDGAENHDEGEGSWLTRRARSHRAYDEWMPVRMSGTAALGDGTRLFRTLRFGQLAELSMLDLRTYRSTPVESPASGEASSSDRSIAGGQQLAWLKKNLANERAQWKLVGNPVMIAPVTFGTVPDAFIDPINDVTKLLPEDGVAYNIDQWDGYTHDRRVLFEHIRDQGITDTVFLTGDIHSAWACELPFDPGSYPVVRKNAGVEFVCTSVTSNNLKDILGVQRRTASVAVETVLTAANPHIRHLNFDDHGYSVLDVTSARVQCDYYAIGDRAVKSTGLTWQASWQTLAGTQQLRRVHTPVGGA
ncbi:MAG TPA: alkaline phosphatase D family protein [Nocardioides sp.]